MGRYPRDDAVKSLLLVFVTAAALVAGGIALVAADDDVDSFASIQSTDAPTAEQVPESTTTTITTITTTTLPAPVAMPDLTGLGYGRALNLLAESGIGRNGVQRVDYPIARFDQLSQVIGQSIEPGQIVPVDSNVDVVMGIRPVPLTVPAEPIPDSETFGARGTVVGRCYNDRLAGTQLELDAIGCDQPHRYQLAASPSIDVGGPFDRNAVAAQLLDLCKGAQEWFVGAPWVGSRLSFAYITPHPDDWAAGKRTGWCFLQHHDDGVRLVADAAGKMW